MNDSRPSTFFTKIMVAEPAPAQPLRSHHPETEQGVRAALEAAKSIIASGDNITYPSRAAAQHVRKIMRDLIEAMHPATGDDTDPGSAIITKEKDSTITVQIRSPGALEYAAVNMPAEIWAKMVASAPLPSEGAVAWQSAEPTKEMAIAGRKALAIVADRMEEAKLLATSSIDFWQRVGHEPANEIYKAMVAATPPSASPSVREATIEECAKFIETQFAGTNLSNVAKLLVADIRALSSGEQEGVLTTRTELNTTKGKV